MLRHTMPIARLAMATLVVALLAAGFALGRLVTATQPQVTPGPTPSSSLETEPRLPELLPVADVDGSDLDVLPRYPGSVRTQYRVRDDAAGTVTKVEYLASGSVEAVRSFYRQAFIDHGWTVVDLQLAYGELRYLITDGEREGEADIESRGGGVVEIDLEVVTRPSASASPTAAPTATPTRPHATPVAPPDDDDAGGDDDGAEDDVDPDG
jgi:hypothetical protein